MPQLGTRVSPRCGIADEMIVATVRDGVVSDRSTERLELADEDDLVERLVGLGVDVLVCGGIRREIEEELRGLGIRVLNNVAGEIGEILDAFRGGHLAAGQSFRPPRPGVEELDRRDPLPLVDCLACGDRACEAGRACPVALGGLSRPWLRGEDARISEIGRDVSAEVDPPLCRIAELVHFCLGTGYGKIGLAYCWELAREVEVLVPVLRRFFSVVPVCCRVGSSPATPEGRPPCNPIAVARLLDAAGTDLNVIAGLCLGTDILFARRSRAPVTTLFVKDRSLAHNPVGAIYTRYHLMDLTSESARARPVRSGRT